LLKTHGYAIAREDLKDLIESLRKLPRDHEIKLLIILLIIGYKRMAGGLIGNV